MTIVNDCSEAPVPEDTSSKRKLSISATTHDDAKRVKTDGHAAKDADAESDDSDGDGDEDDEDDSGSDGSEGGGDETSPYNIRGPGPYTFYCWADAIECAILRYGEIYSVFYHKQSALDAFAPVYQLPKDKRHDAMFNYLNIVSVWEVIVEEEARETPEAKKLWEVYEKIDEEEREKLKARKLAEATAEGGKEKGAVVNSGEDDVDDLWWWELSVQRQKPEAGEPAIEVSLDGVKGSWWVTGFKPADVEGSRAMSFMCTYFNFD